MSLSPRWAPNPDIRRGRSIVCTLHAHLACVPKYRRKVFTDAILTRCEEVTREVCAKANAELKEFNGEADHVDLLIHYPPQVKLSALVGSLKGVSAHYPRKEYADHIKRYLWGDSFWSPCYLAASCGGAPLAVVKEYIESQKRPG